MPDEVLISSGNLATSMRTVAGVLAILSQLGVCDADAAEIFSNHGLPAAALEDPNFPISHDQNLRLLATLVNSRHMPCSPVTLWFLLQDTIELEYFGVLGLLMRHARSVQESLDVCLRYPQLTWGHSRLRQLRVPEGLALAFTFECPHIPGLDREETDRLVAFCVLGDLVSTACNIESILERRTPPQRIELPFAQPGDWALAEPALPCDVVFGASEARLVYDSEPEQQAPPRANPLMFRSYSAIADQLALMLGGESSVHEQVTRWLWACSPPLGRGDIARRLALSERSLTRKLQAEGTSYKTLLAAVQRERACNLLRNRELSVNEIGERLGYSEVAAFSRAFKNWTGESPLNWRQLHQG